MSPLNSQVAEESVVQLPEEAAGFARLPNGQAGFLSKEWPRVESGRGASDVEVK